MNTPTTRSFSSTLRQWLVRNAWRYLVPNVGTVLVVALLLFASRVAADPAGPAPVSTLESPAGPAPVSTLEAPDAGGANAPLASYNTISYQGRLTNIGGTPVNGAVHMAFRLYDTPTGGAALWTEDYPSVTVNDGLFNVPLGSINPLSPALFAGHPSLFLGITVGADGEMAPRESLSSAPYAGVAGGLLDGATGGSLTLAGSLTSGNLTVNGTDIVVRGRNSGGTGSRGRALVDSGPGGGLMINYDNDFGKVTIVGDTTVGGELKYRVSRQDNETNRNVNEVRIQTGWGYLQGRTDRNQIQEDVTYPTGFSETPIVVVTSLGLATSRPDGIDDFSGTVASEAVHATQIRSDKFKMIVARHDGSNFPSGYYYGYSWIAIGR